MQEEDIGELFQDERNMAALLLYKQGTSDQYNMVSSLPFFDEKYLDILLRLPRPYRAADDLEISLAQFDWAEKL